MGSEITEDDLETSLAGLVASELVFQRGVPPEAVYRFKHALVQDAAHGSLLRSAREEYARIAGALETHFPELMNSQPELLAQHYAEAGLIEKSAAYWTKAGHRSATRSTMEEGAAQFQKALVQLALLPDTPQRQRQELELYGSLALLENGPPQWRSVPAVRFWLGLSYALAGRKEHAAAEFAAFRALAPKWTLSNTRRFWVWLFDCYTRSESDLK